MPQDHEVTREVWEGKIPVEFVLADGDVTLLEKPKPYYVLVPRVSYFPLVLEKVQKYYLSAVPPEEVEEVWLEYEGIPIKWHYPIGLLFDLLKTDDALPWQITLHVKNFPREEIVHLNQKDAIEANFMQTLKEADQLKHKATVINSMQKRDHKQLWNGLVNDRYEQFWSVNKRLMENSLEEPLNCLPIRLFLPDKPFIQKVCRPFKEDGERETLRSLLTPLGLSQLRPITHGVELPLETPLLWLAENMSFPDNFVHVCLHEI